MANAGIAELPAPCRLCGSAAGERDAGGWRCAYCGWSHGDVPDYDLAPPRVDVVYYLRHGDRLKIGTTGNPRQRFSAIWHQEVMAFEIGDRTVERRRHEEFAVDRFARSEWFTFSTRLQRHVTELARVGDPWQLYARWIADAHLRRGRN